MTRPVITDVTIAPNPVDTGQKFQIAVSIFEETLVKTIDPKFEFEFESVAAQAPDLNMGDIAYVPATQLPPAQGD